MTPNPYIDTTATRLAGGLIRVDSPSGHAIYDATRLDQFGRYPLTHGSSTTDRRAAATMFVASFPCEAFAGFHTVEHNETGHLDAWGNDVEPVACGQPAVILLDDGTETTPVCEHHHD